MTGKNDQSYKNDSGLKSTKAVERLVSTARWLFCHKGIATTGIQEVLETANVSRMTLYNNFGSKKALVNAALRLEGQQWREWFFQRIEESGKTAQTRLKSIFQVLEEWLSSDDYYGCSFINAIAESDKADTEIRALALEHKSQIKGYLHRLAREAGCNEVDSFVDKLILIIDGIIVCRLGNPSRSLRAESEQLLGMLLEAHGASGGRKSAA